MVLDFISRGCFRHIALQEPSVSPGVERGLMASPQLWPPVTLNDAVCQNILFYFRSRKLWRTFMISRAWQWFWKFLSISVLESVYYSFLFAFMSIHVRHDEIWFLFVSFSNSWLSLIDISKSLLMNSSCFFFSISIVFFFGIPIYYGIPRYINEK